jgi:class 3 adenylate cyclase
MPYPEQTFRWSWQLTAPPAALWPLVSNTDRFNRDCGYPAISPAPAESTKTGPVTNARRLRTRKYGVPIVWDEYAFEWVAPHRFAVERIYRGGPLARMVVTCELTPRPEGGTLLAYEVRVTPANLVGRLAIPFEIGRLSGATMTRVFRRYDEFALHGLRVSALAHRPKLATGGAERLDAVCRALIDEHGQPAELVTLLRRLIASGDDTTLARLRPYAVADDWKTDRRATLHLFLHATRAGILDFSWDLVCPHCRGAQRGSSSLTRVTGHGHCDSCHIDFDANFDQSVEVTFTPNAAIRAVVRADYCVGGPQVTPHIIAQQRIAPRTRQTLQLQVAPGRYRVRTPQVSGQSVFRVDCTGEAALSLDLAQPLIDEPALAPTAELTVENGSDEPRMAVMEHMAWTDQATTAAEVTSLQLFRDLFSREVLRPGEQISVGAMTIVFTDLKNSTQLYRQIGDAPAFGRVLTHFEILKVAVADEGGCIVKTMGDAVMAVFPRPISALRAMLRAHRWLAQPGSMALPASVAVPPSSLQPLALKAGIHAGPCLAINQNERLDYFGTTVNTTARLCGQCTGDDLVLSLAVCADPEVAAFLSQADAPANTPDRLQLKGLGDAPFDVRRVLAASAG